MTFKKITYTIFFLITGINGMAQNKAIIDSLLYQLNITSSDSARADIYTDLCWNYRVDSPRLGYDYGTKAMKIYVERKNILKQCNVLNKLGINKRNLGEYSAALDDFYKILSIAENPLCNLEIAYANNNIADIYSRLEKYDKALEFIDKAFPLFQSVGNKKGIAYNLNLKGSIYESKKDWKNALNYYKLGLELRLKINDISGAATSFVHIGDCCLELNLPDSALIYYKKGIEYYDKAGFTNYGTSYISLGKYHTAKKNYKKAFYYLEEAISKAQVMKSPMNIQKANEVLHTVYYELKNYKKAYEIQTLAREGDESLRRSDYIKKITTLELNYAFDQQAKQNEIDVLKKKALYESHIYKQQLLSYGLVFLLFVVSIITFLVYRNYRFTAKTNSLLKEYNEEISRQKIAIQTQNEQLQELNATKDKFFSIIAHDLRNPFNGILGISELLVSSGDSFTHKEITSMIKMIHESSQNAFDLLENLLEWSKANTGKIDFNPETFMLDKSVNEVVSLVENLSKQKNIVLNYQIAENLNVFADRNMINTILRNLITNAIKFTHTNGEINVIAERQSNEIMVHVRDTGVGISEVEIDKLFKISEKTTSRGTKDEKGTGLGLLLCKEFVEKHGGKIWVESQLGKGSDFIFTLPDHHQ
jgi:signal transduction histidine kinase/nitrogen regulatory protein PII-like uncharacterized protein